MSRPSTVRVACRIEARMIPPESTTVPSRSKRMTGKRIAFDGIQAPRAYSSAMSVGPRLAVLAVLAAGGTAFGGYYLWPSGRHIAACAAAARARTDGRPEGARCLRGSHSPRRAAPARGRPRGDLVGSAHRAPALRRL